MKCIQRQNIGRQSEKNMLDLKRFYVRLKRADDKTGSYTQWFIEATDAIDAKLRARHLFGQKWEVLEVDGPWPDLD